MLGAVAAPFPSHGSTARDAADGTRARTHANPQTMPCLSIADVQADRVRHVGSVVLSPAPQIPV